MVDPAARYVSTCSSMYVHRIGEDHRLWTRAREARSGQARHGQERSHARGAGPGGSRVFATWGQPSLTISGGGKQKRTGWTGADGRGRGRTLNSMTARTEPGHIRVEGAESRASPTRRRLAVSSHQLARILIPTPVGQRGQPVDLARHQSLGPRPVLSMACRCQANLRRMDSLGHGRRATKTLPRRVAM